MKNLRKNIIKENLKNMDKIKDTTRIIIIRNKIMIKDMIKVTIIITITMKNSTMNIE